MNRFTQDKNKLCYLYDSEKVWIEAWGKNSLRIRATHMPKMPEENWALLDMCAEEQINAINLEINISEIGASITNGNIKATITHFGKITIYNQNDKILLSEYVRNWSDVKAEYASALLIDAREFKPLMGGDYKLTMRFESLSDNERIYGMGQYQQPHLNLKGTELELAQRNSQASVPFAVSSLGYGFLWNNPAVGRVTFGKNTTIFEF